MNTQFKKGALELCVLSQLMRGDKYGYELTERISSEMSIAGGTLYPILRRLKEEAYVTTYLIESESGPARKYYSLTETGKRYQESVAQEWEEFIGAVNRLISE
ncbi:MAG: PadR family transcriptional regulator [bacterium]|nr:PadR family transcriptional regulator [bacterium]